MAFQIRYLIPPFFAERRVLLWRQPRWREKWKRPFEEVIDEGRARHVAKVEYVFSRASEVSRKAAQKGKDATLSKASTMDATRHCT